MLVVHYVSRKKHLDWLDNLLAVLRVLSQVSQLSNQPPVCTLTPLFDRLLGDLNSRLISTDAEDVEMSRAHVGVVERVVFLAWNLHT